MAEQDARSGAATEHPACSQAAAKESDTSMRFRGKVEALGTLRKLTDYGVKAALKEMQDRYKSFRGRYQMRLELIGNR
jgi:hypothetical protein